jgi:hypothetical protein
LLSPQAMNRSLPDSAMPLHDPQPGRRLGQDAVHRLTLVMLHRLLVGLQDLLVLRQLALLEGGPVLGLPRLELLLEVLDLLEAAGEQIPSVP